MSEYNERLYQQRVLELTHAVGLALGALEVVNIQSYDFNKDGIVFVIERLRKIVDVGFQDKGEKK